MYLDIFTGPDTYETSTHFPKIISSRLKSYRVQNVSDACCKKENNESTPLKRYQPFGEEEDLGKMVYVDIISLDLNAPNTTREKAFSFYYNQLFEHHKYNSQVCLENSLSKTMDHTILDVQDSCLDGNHLEKRTKISFMDNKALWIHVMVMLGPHCPTLHLNPKIIFNSSTKTRSIIHQNFYAHSHKVFSAPLNPFQSITEKLSYM